MFDASMFFNRRGAADIAGGMEQGMRIGDMIRKRKRSEQEQENKVKLGEAYKNNTMFDAQGKATLNQGAFLKDIATIAPDQIMNYQNAFNQEEANRLKQQQLQEDRKFDRDYKTQSLELQGKKVDIDRLKADQAHELAKKKFDEKKKKQKISPDQYKVAGFSKRASMAEQDLLKLPKDIGTSGLSDTIQGSSFYPEAWKSENRKLFEQTQRQFISAVLRRESGAAITDQEMENESMKYFPQPGDGAAVVAQKAKARQQAVNNLQAEGGSASGMIANAPEVPVNLNKKGMKIPGINDAYAKNPEQVFKKVKSMSREEKLKFMSE